MRACLPRRAVVDAHATGAIFVPNPPKALGLKLGAFHVEAKYTSRGPRLIEVNARMGGGPVRCARSREGL